MRVLEEEEDEEDEVHHLEAFATPGCRASRVLLHFPLQDQHDLHGEHVGCVGCVEKRVGAGEKKDLDT